MRVKWTKLALKSLVEATEYIREDNPDMARGVVTQIHQAVANLKSFPNMGVSTDFPDTRDLVHPKYDFLIRYRVGRDLVEIVFVWHTSRDFRSWPGEE